MNILAIDQGTTNTKAVLVGPEGEILAQASRPTAVSYPLPGWAESSADDIWASVASVIEEIVAMGLPVDAIGLSNQRESVVLWDAATGRPVGPCVIWQCGRSAPRCEALKADGYEPDAIARTGLTLNPMFSAGKLSWLLDHASEGRARAARGELKAGTVDAWLLWKLTGGATHATDHSNASRTQLMNLSTLAWDPEMARLFDIPLEVLPEIRPSDALFGETASGATALPAGVPIHAAMGDSHAALYGHGLDGPGRIKATCGTGSSLMTVTRERIWSAHGLSSTIAWSRAGGALHALEGNISVSGHTVAFVTKLLGLRDELALTDLALTVPDSGGVALVPALAGLGAPHWRDEARGLVSGMNLGTTPAHLARAALEAVALQIHDVFMAMQADLHGDLPALNVDGGASRNDVLMQLLADLIDRPVIRADAAELSALGAARLAAEGMGIKAPRVRPAERTFEPSMSADVREATVARWQDALRRAML
ncbi:FGGY-family carbohydrate kinase [Caulobacter sp.]|uniref:FGGY family carbohydrate kinase n=1 Tax=Caulobacter sp. TaxID=78 RepID=UPI001B2ACA0C|nr:FGGY-family carbohydrate kinase [Caulobacter sp.]MBO9545922.1 FGGY-family carbohydrate kinase [Caulobacter sp.]